MLTLEQTSAVNDGFHNRDLDAALKPLEDTIDLRVAELPRLDKKAVAALKLGLRDGDDAATWAQAVLHPNASVRRFARKIFIGLGDDAAPIFAPLRARLERFWNEEEPLPETNKPREAALQREQNEQIVSALEILLRADPERFMAFYAQVSDNADNSSHAERITEARAWSERNQAAYKVTQAETDRLVVADWGAKYADYSERYKLPSRVLRELDERARANPKIALMWRELGESPYGLVNAAWNPKGLLAQTWEGYLTDHQATGPTKRVAARVRPFLWQWIQSALDFESDPAARAQCFHRLDDAHTYYGTRNFLDDAQWLNDVPALLLAAKAPLLGAIRAVLEAREDYAARQKFAGDELSAELWVALAETVARFGFRPYGVIVGKWGNMPALEPETLRALARDLTDVESGHGTLGLTLTAAKHLELEREARAKTAEIEDPQVARGAEQRQAVATRRRESLLRRAVLSPANALPLAQLRHINETFNNADDGGSYAKAQAESERQAEIVALEIIALDEATRLQRLIEAPHPRVEGAYIGRAAYLTLWSRDFETEKITPWEARFFERVEPQLWARMETQLDAHRRIETEPIEPSIEQKLTARETKEWRTRVRREKRAVIANDVQDIALNLGAFGGVAARLRAIAMADRPSCRGISERLETMAFALLEEAPDPYYSLELPVEMWREWTLDAQWDAIIEKLKARLPHADEGWERRSFERQLATGYYRRGDFAGFERHAVAPDAYPQVVSAAAAATEDFEAWRVLVGVATPWEATHLKKFWEVQLADETRRARAIETVAQIIAVTNVEKVSKNLLDWLKSLAPEDFSPYISEVENALESAIPNVRKWAIAILSALPDADFDRKRAAQTAGEMLWSENAGLAKDAAKFLSVLGAQDAAVAAIAWDALSDATALENIGLCEAIYRALVKVRSKHKSFELGEAAREKLDKLATAQSERFGKFTAKL